MTVSITTPAGLTIQGDSVEEVAKAVQLIEGGVIAPTNVTETAAKREFNRRSRVGAYDAPSRINTTPTWLAPSPEVQAAAERVYPITALDHKILETLRVFTDGLLTTDLAALMGLTEQKIRDNGLKPDQRLRRFNLITQRTNHYGWIVTDLGKIAKVAVI